MAFLSCHGAALEVTDMPKRCLPKVERAISKGFRSWPLLFLVASGSAAANTGPLGFLAIFPVLSGPIILGVLVGAVVRMFGVVCPRGFVISWSVVVIACLVLLLLSFDVGSALLGTLMFGFVGSFPYYFGYWLGNRLNDWMNKWQ